MTITPATEFTIDANGAQTIGVDQINSTQSIVLYYDSIAGDFEVRVVESDESVGAAETVTNNPSLGVTSADVCVLSSSQAIVAYCDTSTAQLEVAVVAISGTTLTFNSGSILGITGTSGGESSVRIIRLSATSFMLIHGSTGVATYLTVSGTTITEESQASVDAIQNASLTFLSSTKALTAYTDLSDSDIFKMCVLTVSGTTVSAGTPVNVEVNDVGSSGENGDTALASIDGSTALLAYANHTDEILKAVVISISGSTPSANTPENIDTWSSVGGEAIRSVALINFSTAQFGLSYNYQIAGDSNIAEVTVSGTSVTDQGSITLTSDNTAGSRAIMFSASLGIVVYSGTAKGVIVTLTTGSRLWLRNATPVWNNIGDGAWVSACDAVAYLPGSSYQTIYAAIGTGIYETTDGGSNWASVATLTFTPSSIFLTSADKLIAYNKASGGTNRVAVITGLTSTPSVSYLDTGHSTSGAGSTIIQVA